MKAVNMVGKDMNKFQFSDYLDKMTAVYEIDVTYGKDFAEATSPYLEGVVEYGNDTYEALLGLCSSIEVTEEIIGRRLFDKKY
jgi:hypothetical protein